MSISYSIFLFCFVIILCYGVLLIIKYHKKKKEFFQRVEQERLNNSKRREPIKEFLTEQELKELRSTKEFWF